MKTVNLELSFSTFCFGMCTFQKLHPATGVYIGICARHCSALRHFCDWLLQGLPPRLLLEGESVLWLFLRIEVPSQWPQLEGTWFSTLAQAKQIWAWPPWMRNSRGILRMPPWVLRTRNQRNKQILENLFWVGLESCTIFTALIQLHSLLPWPLLLPPCFPPPVGSVVKAKIETSLG